MGELCQKDPDAERALEQCIKDFKRQDKSFTMENALLSPSDVVLLLRKIEQSTPKSADEMYPQDFLDYFGDRAFLVVVSLDAGYTHYQVPLHLPYLWIQWKERKMLLFKYDTSTTIPMEDMR